ncbi:MAG TPA: hypothetical protein VJR92_09845 [Gemmatimonadaceae bacterium]|nr:hypothetical protein [Gemmatimonadaceae bacterium]
MRRAMLLAFSLVLAATPLRAQEVVQQTPPQQAADLTRVFLDCNTFGCDDDFFRTEITWVNFVRDRADAHVHVLVTAEGTGSGGRQFTITFDGIGSLAGVRDSLTTVTRQGDTDDEVRRELMRVLSVGLVRYARATSIGTQLQVSLRSGARTAAPGARGGRDPWNLWVFSIRTHTFSNGDDNYQNTSVFGNVNARRVSEAWKFSISSFFDYSQNSFKLTDSTLRTYQRSWGQSLLAVKSLSPHWSTGITTGARSSKFENYSLSLDGTAAIEYDLFPYKESTRRQLIFRYGVGVRSFDYDSITVYGKQKETRPMHQLTIAGEARQKWGSLSIGLNGNQYLDEFSQRRASLSGGVNWRIVRGLEFNIDGYYEVVRDQLNIPRGELTDDDILIRLRQLQSGYSYFTSFGLSYTFGSIFNNVVNPRFDR